MVTPVVSPRLFVFFTTLTFGARRRKHIASAPVETIAKKHTETWNARCPRAIMMNCQERNPSLDGKCVSVGVDALAVVEGGEKQDVASMTGSKKRYLLSYTNYPAVDLPPLRFSFIRKPFLYRKSRKMNTDFSNWQKMQP